MRVLVGVLVGILVGAVVLAGCSATGDAPAGAPPTSTTPTYVQEPRQVRPDEVPLTGRPVRDGDTSFALIGLSTGLERLIGSHVEFEPAGQFVRVRLVVVNLGRSGVLFDTNRQLLLLADGSTAAPDRSTMMTKRQPDTFDLGAGVRVEFDLYYDVPADAEPRGLRVFGGPTLTDMKDAEGTDIELEPVR